MRRSSYHKKPKTGRGKGRGWQLDAKTRMQIETAAMDAVNEHYVERGFSVDYVHLQKLGWDMTVKKGNKKFKLEVKGTSGPLQTVELTVNEYANSLYYSNFRVCILEHALNKAAAKLHICRLNIARTHWVSELGDQLRIVEKTSALLQLVRLPVC